MITDRVFTSEERLEIGHLLQNHHTIFKTFWSIGRPLFTKEISTAAVGFDRSGHVIYLIINPDFWDSLDMTNKAFVISHEALHVILDHGRRGNEYNDNKLVNVAQDIVINEMLFADFGYNKYQVKDWSNYCFVETVFSPEEIRDHAIRTRGSFHYYMELLQKAGCEKQTLDDHSFMQGSGQGDAGQNRQSGNLLDALLEGAQEDSEEMIDYFFENFDSQMTDKEKFQFAQTLKEELKSMKAGTTPLGQYAKINPNPVPKKRKWETIVRDHVKSIMRYETVEKDSWISRGRRFSLLDDDLMMQGPWEEEVPRKEKYKIVFFLDSSGSCFHLKDRFVDLMKSIPEDKFEIHPYSFDNCVYPIDLKTGHVRGGGGTYFTILDREIRRITQESRHPDAIFVVSDGDGDRFAPEKPKLWHWILTPRHSLHLIPKESIKHDMKNFD